MNTIGGVRRDIAQEDISGLKEGLDLLEESVKYYIHVITEEETFLMRTRGVGYLSTDKARKLCAVGPTTRASNIKIDVRADDPYAAYLDLDFSVVTAETGDVWGRSIVKAGEIFQSIRICRQILDDLPGGEIRVEGTAQRCLPGKRSADTRRLRGELIYYVKSNGSNMPERVKIRSADAWQLACDGRDAQRGVHCRCADRCRCHRSVPELFRTGYDD